MTTTDVPRGTQRLLCGICASQTAVVILKREDAQELIVVPHCKECYEKAKQKTKKEIEDLGRTSR